ncbi:XkdQ/YqbQ family protein [Acetobacterium tundrae]|nr:hypothetical protein [Acetobacterium tundrae]
MINPATTDYKVMLLRGDGNKYNISQILTDLNWQEAEGDFVQKATISLANIKTSAGMSTEQLLSLCSLVFIFANDKEVFRGEIWEHDDATKPNTSTVTITICDRMIRFNQTKESVYYPEGQTTKILCEQTCQRSETPIKYSYVDYTHGKIVFKNKNVEDQLNELLTEAQSKNTGTKFVCQFEEGILKIRPRGYNADVYVLANDDNGKACITGIEVKTSLSNFVSRVNILGKADTDGREPIENIIDGDLQYGVLTEIIYRDDTSTSDDAITQANTMITERNKPAETITFSVPDVPFIRKGHKVKCLYSEGINGYFYVLSVTHNATQRTMDLKLERAV